MVYFEKNIWKYLGTAIAQWICLHLPSWGPGFKTQLYHLCFFHLSSNIELYCIIVLRKVSNVSVTRLGKIMPRSRNFKSLWQILEKMNLRWQLMGNFLLW